MKFHEAKFRALSEKLQHKKCAELLREQYLQMIGWMGLDGDAPTTVEQVANRFHYHLQKTEKGLKEHNFLPHVATQDKTEAQEYLPICIFLDHLRSTHNIGSIIRTTEALRLGNIFFSEDMAAPSHPQVQNTAMGTCSWVSCHQNQPLESLHRPIIALETIPDATPYYDFKFPKSFTLVVGNEEIGCSEETLKATDYCIQIPLHGRKNSVNVACSFAIVAAEIRRQLATKDILYLRTLRDR